MILIAGGKQKGLDYTSLKPLLAEKVSHFVTLGEIREPLAQLAVGLCPVSQVATLEEAVRVAFDHVGAQETILFSPGTSTFDMFTGYEHRGDTFIQFVQQHLANP